MNEGVEKFMRPQAFVPDGPSGPDGKEHKKGKRKKQQRHGKKRGQDGQRQGQPRQEQVRQPRSIESVVQSCVGQMRYAVETTFSTERGISRVEFKFVKDITQKPPSARILLEISRIDCVENTDVPDLIKQLTDHINNDKKIVRRPGEKARLFLETDTIVVNRVEPGQHKDAAKNLFEHSSEERPLRDDEMRPNSPTPKSPHKAPDSQEIQQSNRAAQRQELREALASLMGIRPSEMVVVPKGKLRERLGEARLAEKRLNEELTARAEAVAANDEILGKLEAANEAFTKLQKDRIQADEQYAAHTEQLESELKVARSGGEKNAKHIASLEGQLVQLKRDHEERQAALRASLEAEKEKLVGAQNAARDLEQKLKKIESSKGTLESDLAVARLAGEEAAKANKTLRAEVLALTGRVRALAQEEDFKGRVIHQQRAKVLEAAKATELLQKQLEGLLAVREAARAGQTDNLGERQRMQAEIDRLTATIAKQDEARLTELNELREALTRKQSDAEAGITTGRTEALADYATALGTIATFNDEAANLLRNRDALGIDVADIAELNAFIAQKAQELTAALGSRENDTVKELTRQIQGTLGELRKRVETARERGDDEASIAPSKDA